MRELFDPIIMKNIPLRNRIIKAATWEGLAAEDGHMTAQLYDVYIESAKGQPGMIFTGYAHVKKEEKPNPGMMGIYDDSFIAEYRRLTELVHQEGTPIMMQIAYGGSMTGLRPASQLIWGPSAVENELTHVTPVEMTQEDIQELITAFAEAAGRVRASGFDGVVIHAAHGYLLNQFMAPHFNRRADQYGGSIENRARLLLEILEAVRKKVGSDYPVLVKINSEDGFEGGLTAEEGLKVCKMLEDAGIDAIEVSGGNESVRSVGKANRGPIRRKINESREMESYFRDFAVKLAETASVPVILTGGNRSLEVMENILNSSNILAFGLARPLLREPDLPQRWKKGDRSPSLCTSCSQCFKTAGRRCIVHPLA